MKFKVKNLTYTELKNRKEPSFKVFYLYTLLCPNTLFKIKERVNTKYRIVFTLVGGGKG